MEFRVDASAARKRWPLAVGFSLIISACGGSSSDDEPEPTDKATSALCSKLGVRIVDDRVADLTMLSPADRAAQRSAAEQAIGQPFMQSCIGKLTVAQVRCGLAAHDSSEIAACIAVAAGAAQ
jgi:hypothetical protein